MHERIDPRRSIGARLLAILLLVCSGPAWALDLSDQLLVYQEDFEGETFFPTVPEVNLLSIGGNSAVAVDGLSDFIGIPPIIGGVLVFSLHSEIPESSANMRIPATFSESFGLRAHFHSFSIGVAPTDGTGRAGVGGGFEPDINFVPKSTIQTNLAIQRSLGAETGFVIVQYDEPPFSPLLTYVALSAPVISAVLGGAPFTVDLAFDKTTMIATGSVEIQGFGVFTAPPLDVSTIATITPSSPLGSVNPFLLESDGMDADVDLEDVSVFVLSTLIGDQVLIEQNSTSSGTLRSDLVTVVEGSPEVSCPGAFDLCTANIPGFTQGNFDIESDTLTLNVGLSGGTTVFTTESFNGYIFSDLDLATPITAVALSTDIPGLTSTNVTFTADSVSVNFSGLTVDPGQFFTIELNPTTPAAPQASAMTIWGLVALTLASLTAMTQSVRRRA